MTAAESPPRDPDSEIDAFGRVGYGKLARYSPLILGAVMVAAIVFIAFNQEADGPATRSLIGQPAPELNLTPFGGGEAYALSTLRGDVVVLNFWASWCEPCKAEMPALQAVHAEGAGDVAVVGVNIKNDRVDAAQSLIDATGVTYTLVRDIGGEHQLYGPVELALGGDAQYPVTVFIRPDGAVDAIRIGEMEESEIRDRIEDARD